MSEANESAGSAEAPATPAGGSVRSPRAARRHEATGVHSPHGAGHQGAGHHPHSRKELAFLSLGALGVVYGDIGTSPLYAVNECLLPTKEHAVKASLENVHGVMSLFFWTLVLVVVVKYLIFVLRADNKGEGGILALAALVAQKAKSRGAKLSIPILLALFGAGLLYGDGVITPAISVLGALEGLSEQSPALTTFIVPLTVLILIALFSIQRHGTHKIGAIAGWVMLVWFLAIGAAGLPHIIQHPIVLYAISPHHAVWFLHHHAAHGFLLLGLVVLCVTGTEALYADMGHFGKSPIRIAWSFVVFPCLLLNYFGQGAVFLSGAHITNSFYDLVPSSLVIPMTVLATVAAIIASQALISGAFSLTNQAVQLGYFPRVTVVHTSSKMEGQIYIPEVNYALMVACVVLVFSFQNSSNLAAAYGIAVTGTMAITSFLYFLVCRNNWNMSLPKALAIFIPFVLLDLTFFSANAVKIVAGGWFPLAVGAGVFVIMTTWWRGRRVLSEVMEGGVIPQDAFLGDPDLATMHRVPGTAVFMASSADGIPNVLLHHVKHNKVLHKQVVLLSIISENVPFSTGNKSIEVKDLGQGFYRVLSRHGFMQQTNVPKVLQRCEKKHHLSVNLADTTYYLGRQTLLTTGNSALWKWRKLLFSFLARNSRPPTAFFNLPPNRVVELGLQIEL